MYEDEYGSVPKYNNSTYGQAVIKVIGVGGGGCNAVNRMIDAKLSCAEFIAVNTDNQVLQLSLAKTKIQIGKDLTKGLGAGADPEVGRMAAEESKDEIQAVLEGTDLLFITAGLGGGTGTGAAPVIAKMARDLKILTVAVVTEPFSFEGRVRMDNTLKGLENLKKYVDTLVIVPNDKLLSAVEAKTTYVDALKVADEILKQSVAGISEIIVCPGIINVDFADVKTTLKDKGIAHIGVGSARGENRVLDAIRAAVNSPLLETTIEGAHSVLINVVGGPDLTLSEAQSVGDIIKDVIDAQANVIYGVGSDPNAKDQVQVTIIATDFTGYDKKQGTTQPQNPQYAQGAYTQPNQGYKNDRIGGNQYWSNNGQIQRSQVPPIGNGYVQINQRYAQPQQAPQAQQNQYQGGTYPQNGPYAPYTPVNGYYYPPQAPVPGYPMPGQNPYIVPGQQGQAYDANGRPIPQQQGYADQNGKYQYDQQNVERPADKNMPAFVRKLLGHNKDE